ncbi:hypothetical protein B484DRAFT_436673 [Ochromonadaceae sp. CCMP2298]|nr:hypothetical protein B484DRAFT_436673 [Ochromonadaceae sp. CCMP2298]
MADRPQWQQQEYTPQRYSSAQVKPDPKAFRPPARTNGSTESMYHRSLAPSPTASYQPQPRSASEALFDTSSKFRQLPCRTFISVGTCPYRERCVYLHDPRCIYKEASTKTRRKNKEDVVLDSLFWPVMPYAMVAVKLDLGRQPHVIQSYSVPMPQKDQYHRHDAAVYSLWMHFVDFSLANMESTAICAGGADHAACYSAPEVPHNSYTQEARLSVFRHLSRGAGANGTYANTSPGTSTGANGGAFGTAGTNTGNGNGFIGVNTGGTGGAGTERTFRRDTDSPETSGENSSQSSSPDTTFHSRPHLNSGHSTLSTGTSSTMGTRSDQDFANFGPEKSFGHFIPKAFGNSGNFGEAKDFGKYDEPQFGHAFGTGRSAFTATSHTPPIYTAHPTRNALPPTHATSQNLQDASSMHSPSYLHPNPSNNFQTIHQEPYQETRYY